MQIDKPSITYYAQMHSPTKRIGWPKKSIVHSWTMMLSPLPCNITTISGLRRGYLSNTIRELVFLFLY